MENENNNFNSAVGDISLAVEEKINEVKNLLERPDLTEDEQDTLNQILANLEEADENLGVLYRF